MHPYPSLNVLHQPVVLVHGGAGNVAPHRRPLHADGCRVAAAAALAELERSGDPLAAVLEAVRHLENNPLFNAGTGACLTCEETIELDAAVMLGSDLSCGAVGALSPFQNPILIADAVRRDGEHVFYAGAGATLFAQTHGFDTLASEALITDASRDRLARVLAGESGRGWAGNTVGAVASNGRGQTAAATSTGGTVGKRLGRLGDTPVIGAGTWADDQTGACSTTGIGEGIIRFGLARDVCERLRTSVSAQAACDAAIDAFSERVDGHGGLVMVTGNGDVGWSRNTDTMSFALAKTGQKPIFGY